MKWYPRACPACGGDLYEDVQSRGWAECLMCGREYQLSSKQKPPPRPSLDWGDEAAA